MGSHKNPLSYKLHIEVYWCILYTIDSSGFPMFLHSDFYCSYTGISNVTVNVATFDFSIGGPGSHPVQTSKTINNINYSSTNSIREIVLSPPSIVRYLQISLFENTSPE